MKIVKGFPPNYADIVAAIPAVKVRPLIIFTYGDTVYCPHADTNLSDHLIAHEQTHIDEQAIVGPEAWWERYLAQPEYRLEQELMAYQNQFHVLAEKYTRNNRKLILSKMTKDLAGTMYGKIIDKKQAWKLITEGGSL